MYRAKSAASGNVLHLGVGRRPWLAAIAAVLNHARGDLDTAEDIQKEIRSATREDWRLQLLRHQ